MKHELTDTTFNQLADFIREHTGIHIPPTKKYLVENRLVKIIEEQNLKGYDEYLYRLRYSSNGKDLDRLFDAITTNETYFFREPLQFDLLTEAVLPRLIEARGGQKSVRIWSAACSSGEEPYTLAIVMKERRPDIQFDILATDLSRKVIESAQRGIYSSYSVRNVPKPYVMKYFTMQGQDFLLDQKIKTMVRFKTHNLLDGHRPEGVAGGFDLIFCRNVLIYFDQKTKQRAVSMLYDSLKLGGILIIGSSESLHNVTRAFKPVTINRVVVYEKL